MSTYEDNYLAHHGIMGQKWGVRRYQNPDGSLTAEGRIHYGIGQASTLQNHGLERMDGKTQAKLTKEIKNITTHYQGRASWKGGKNQFGEVTMPGAIKKFNGDYSFRSCCTNAAIFGIQAYQKCGLGEIGNYNDLATREAFLFGKKTAAYAQLAMAAAAYTANSAASHLSPVDAFRAVKAIREAGNAKMDNPALESIRQAVLESDMSPAEAKQYVMKINEMKFWSGNGIPFAATSSTLASQGWGSHRKFAGSNGDNTKNDKYYTTDELNRRMMGKD